MINKTEKLTDARERLRNLSTFSQAPVKPVQVKPGQVLENSILRLRVTDVKQFDKNPRSRINPKYQAIYDSILSRGSYPGVFSVTKRPNDSSYMLCAGGNTRLEILQKIWLETKNTAFEYINASFVNYTSESDIIALHLIENEVRGDTSVFERAQGLIGLKQTLEQEGRQLISSRELETIAKKMGMDVTHSTIQFYDFMLDKFEVLGPILSFSDLKRLRPIVNQHIKTLENFDGSVNQYISLLKLIQEQHIAKHDLTIESEIENNQIDDFFEVLQKTFNTLLKEFNFVDDIKQKKQSTDKPRTIPTSNELTDIEIDKPQRLIAATIVPQEDKLSAIDLVKSICEMAGISHFLKIDPCLQNGFYMELPNKNLDTTKNARTSAATWQFLCAISNQCDPVVTQNLPDHSRFKQMMGMTDVLDVCVDTEYPHITGGLCSSDGELGMLNLEIRHILLHPEIGTLIIKLMSITLLQQGIQHDN